MKIKLFNVARSEEVKQLKQFVEEHQIIDIKLSAGVDVGQVIVMYDDKTFKIKYFCEDDYVEEAEYAYRTSYTLMKNAVNKFCANHDVVNIETAQNSDEDLVTVVTYKE